MAASIGSVKEYFETLQDRFVPAASKGVDAVFQYELSGSEAGTWHVIIKDGAVSWQEGAHDKPTATLAADSGDYVKIVNGEMSGLKAVMSGKMKVTGNRLFARKMQKILPTA
jgi:putative sterol carrier protein